MIADYSVAYGLRLPEPGRIRAWRSRLALGESPAAVAVSVVDALRWETFNRASSPAQVAALIEWRAWALGEVLDALGVDRDAVADVVRERLVLDPLPPEPIRRPEPTWRPMIFDPDEIPLQHRSGVPAEAVSRIGSVDEDALAKILAQRDRLHAAR